MEVMLEETILVIQTIVTGLFFWSFRESQKLLTNIEKVPTYQVGSPLNEKLSSSKNSMLDYVAVQGLVTATGDPIMTSTGIPAVIKLQLSYDHFRNRIFGGKWGGSQQLVSSTTIFLPFGLRKPGKSSDVEIVHINEAATAHLNGVLTTVGSTFSEHQESNLGTLFSMVFGRKDAIEVKEKVLLVDTLLTVAGKVIRGSDGVIHVHNPKDKSMPYIVTSGSMHAVVDTFRSQRNAYFWCTIIFGSISIVLLGRFTIKLLRKFTMKKICRDILRKRSPKGIVGLSDAQICIACLGNPREVLFSPCGHICTCVECWIKLEDQKCPVCREKIRAAIPAFIP